MQHKLEDIFNIKKKQILITGANGFLGRHIAKAFLDVGARVILLSRSDRLSKQLQAYRKEFGKENVSGFQVDFYKRKEMEHTLKKVSAQFDIDVLINNAYDLSKKTGFNTQQGRLENSTYKQWKAAFESGIYWAVLTTQIIGRQFRKKKRGNIINISSMYGIVSPHPELYEGTDFFNPPTYGVNKAGLIALTRYTAAFLGRDGIRCNAVAPGPFPNQEDKSSNSVEPNDFFLDRLKTKTVLQRVGQPKDLKGIMIYLSSDASSFMTGQVISIDGGWTIT